ncbi:hypothetical protein SETIT_6G049700v2 [Setaria italica]|uniref:Uncharacterized protein n=1 Tax=Setaria italica TaxID=4555 RepID=A0A368RJW6_SETIT|nr:hypothetical protein SETIT_6G049700v2 [Setaria italica]
MDPQPFVRLSVGQLGLKLPGGNASKASSRLCDCEIPARRFPVQTRRWSLRRRRSGATGSPCCLHHGWAGIGKGAAEARPELHLRVKMEADPRYIFQFDDEVALNPQVVQLHGSSRQPIFSCKFIRDRRRPSQGDGQYWSSSGGSEETDMEMAMRRERKGWKVVIHDLSGSAVAAAFMATPFVPAPGGDTVARSNPGAWLIVRAGTTGSSDSWQPWGRLEAWRESSSSAPAASSRDTVRLRLHLLPDGQDDCVLVSEAPLGSDKGGEFSIDMDRQAPAPVPAAAAAAGHCAVSLGAACAGGGFVMSCKVEGEARSSRPFVQLAMRHVTCMEDAAMFVALAAAVDLSVKACRPFRRKPGKKAASPSPDPLELDT